MKKAYYFTHDINARSDEKILCLRAKYGAAGYGVYFMILEVLRESTDGTFTRNYDLLAYELRVDSEMIRSVVEDFSLFEFQGERFFSKRMLENIQKQNVASQKGKEYAQNRWASKEEEEKTTKPKATKTAKFTKEDFKKEFIRKGANSSDLDDWMSIRVNKKTGFSKAAMEKFIRDSEKHEYTIPQAVRICAEMGWAGIYKRKEDDTENEKRTAQQAYAAYQSAANIESNVSSEDGVSLTQIYR